MKYKNSYYTMTKTKSPKGKNKAKSASRRALAIQRRTNNRIGGRGWRKYDNPTPPGFKVMTAERFKALSAEEQRKLLPESLLV